MTIAELIDIAEKNDIKDFKIVFKGVPWAEVNSIFISYATRQIYLW